MSYQGGRIPFILVLSTRNIKITSDKQIMRVKADLFIFPSGFLLFKAFLYDFTWMQKSVTSKEIFREIIGGGKFTSPAI